MAGERVLVTGATGFIATHCIIQLLKAGYRVRGTVRDVKRAENIRAIIARHAEGADAIEFVAADLNKDDGWPAAVENCQYVLHVASPLPIKLPRNPDDLIRPARDGALRVLRAAKGAGVKRVVMTSSLAAVVYGHDPYPTEEMNEEYWSDPDSPDNTAYTRSKAIAEKAAWDYVDGEGAGLELATINPGLVLGPVLEKDYGTSVEIVRRIMANQLPGYPRVGFPCVDVRDVAAAHVAAMTADGAAGERFAITNDFIWAEDLGAILKKAYPDRKMPKGHVPGWLIKIASNFDADMKQIIPELGKTRQVSHAKATRILGWTPRSNEEAALASAESLIEHGVV